MVEYQDGMKLFDTDMDAIELGIQGVGVLSGCVCSATGVDVTVSWTGGVVKTRSDIRSVSGGSVSLSSLQNASYPRKVMVYVDDSDGTVQTVAGAPQAAYPVGNTGRNTWQPAPPDFSGSYALAYDDVVLAEIWLGKIGAVIASADVTDRRIGIENSHVVSNGLTTDIAQRITGANGQTAGLFVVETYDGIDRFVIDKDGNMTFPGNLASLAVTGAVGVGTTLHVTGSSQLNSILITNTLTDSIPMLINGASGQTADLLSVKQFGDTVVFRVDKDGKAYFPLSRTNGSATVTATNAYATVTHGLSATPTLSQIRLSPQDNLLGRALYPSNADATTFRINLTALDTIDHVVNWEAEI